MMPRASAAPGISNRCSNEWAKCRLDTVRFDDISSLPFKDQQTPALIGRETDRRSYTTQLPAAMSSAGTCVSRLDERRDQGCSICGASIIAEIKPVQCRVALGQQWLWRLDGGARACHPYQCGIYYEVVRCTESLPPRRPSGSPASFWRCFTHLKCSAATATEPPAGMGDAPTGSIAADRSAKRYRVSSLQQRFSRSSAR